MKPLKFLSAIYAQDKIDARAAEFARIDTLQDKGERMMAYHRLLCTGSTGLLKKGWLRAGQAGAVVGAVGVAGFSLLLFGSLLSLPAITAVMSFGLPLAIGGIMTGFLGPQVEMFAYWQAGQMRLDDKIRAKLANEEADATLENLGPSAQLSNVLRDFPQLKKRFHEAVLQKAIKNNGETTPVMRLALQK